MDTQARTNQYSPQARKVAAVIAAIAFAALAVQPFLGEFGYLENTGLLLRFFTIWGNIAAWALLAAIAFGRSPSLAWMAAIATQLTVIGVIYWALLSGIHHPVGLDKITNQSHHTFVPIAFVLFWLRYTPRAASTFAMIPVIMVPPLSYGAFALVLGHFTGFYAYFFVDLNELGWTQYLINNVGLSVFFAVLGALLVTIKNWLQPFIAERLEQAASNPAPSDPTGVL